MRWFFDNPCQITRGEYATDLATGQPEGFEILYLFQIFNLIDVESKLARSSSIPLQRDRVCVCVCVREREREGGEGLSRLK